MPSKPKQKRERFKISDASHPLREHRIRSQNLADQLKELRSAYPGFAGRIDQFISTVLSDSVRTRAYDRKKVLELLRSWPCGLSVKELMEDTGYSQWDVRQILDDLIKRRLVLKVPGSSRRQPYLYKLA